MTIMGVRQDGDQTLKRWILIFRILLLTGIISLPACRPLTQPSDSFVVRQSDFILQNYAVQVGAFREYTNALRFTRSLNRQNIDAYYFIDESGFYKVRIGNFSDEDKARQFALHLQNQGVIDDYFVIPPQITPGVRTLSSDEFRKAIVSTASRFLGSPYRYGGASPDSGFDCSGLVMTVYRLNGIDLPRTSAEQFKDGDRVKRSALDPGDLVFFSTIGNKKISHVGICIGGDQFIHAPGRNKEVRISRLDSAYYVRRFAGACTYLRALP